MEKLTADLPGLRRASITSNKDRKRLLRTLMADVTVLFDPDRGARAVRDGTTVPGRLGWRATCATPRSHYVERL